VLGGFPAKNNSALGGFPAKNQTADKTQSKAEIRKNPTKQTSKSKKK